MSAPVVAFFDLDNTIVKGGSLYHLARGLRRQHFFKKGEFARFLLKNLKFVVVGKELRGDTDWIRKMALSATAGHSVEQIELLGNDICEQFIVPKVYQGTHELAVKHLQRGEEVWIVTASPRRVANILARQLGFTGALGSEAEVSDGIFTGRMLGPILHGKAKAEAVRDWAAERGIDLQLCTAYSDSYNDLPLLEAVGNPIVINADRKLRLTAKRRGWASYDFRRLRLARRFGPHTALAALSAGVFGALRKRSK